MAATWPVVWMAQQPKCPSSVCHQPPGEGEVETSVKGRIFLHLMFLLLVSQCDRVRFQ